MHLKTKDQPQGRPEFPSWYPEECHDHDTANRFEALLGTDWDHLCPAIRKRFARHLSANESLTYQGMIVETRMNRAGALLAQAARIAGAPLPVERCKGGTAAVVTVTEMPVDERGRGGQFWTRVYGRKRGFPQIISSVKRFSGETGLEEEVCGGLSMSLTLSTTRQKLTFRSARFFITLLGLKLRLPRFLSPGQLTVVHEDLGRGWFSFTLSLRHKLFGELMYQHSVFSDPQNLDQMEALNG